MLQLNGSRKLIGILRGYDVFLNIVLDDTFEITKDNKERSVGNQTVIRGNSVISVEALENLS